MLHGGSTRPHRWISALAVLALVGAHLALAPTVSVAATVADPQPVVAIHVSERTAALESANASPTTPSGAGTTGREWWTPWWRYFVAYQSLEAALKADGTPYVEVSDAQIEAGELLTTGGLPRFPIVISLAAEAVADAAVSPLREYVRAGGFLMLGSSSLTRTPSGASRGDFALAAEMGLHSTTGELQNWGLNDTFTRLDQHRVTAHMPAGSVLWSGRESADTPAWNFHARRAWRVTNGDAQVLASGDTGVELATKAFGAAGSSTTPSSSPCSATRDTAPRRSRTRSTATASNGRSRRPTSPS